LGVWGSAVSSRSAVWGEAPAANDFGAFSWYAAGGIHPSVSHFSAQSAIVNTSEARERKNR